MPTEADPPHAIATSSARPAVLGIRTTTGLAATTEIA